MPSVLPVQAICRGGSTRWIVEVIVPGPAFQRKTVPGATLPWIVIDLTSRFQLGQRSNAVSTSQTAAGEAAISISLVPTTDACSLIPVGASTLEASEPRSDTTPSLAPFRRLPGKQDHMFGCCSGAVPRESAHFLGFRS